MTAIEKELHQTTSADFDPCFEGGCLASTRNAIISIAVICNCLTSILFRYYSSVSYTLEGYCAFPERAAHHLNLPDGSRRVHDNPNPCGTSQPPKPSASLLHQNYFPRKC